MSTDDPLSARALLRESTWLRDLARRLVRDPARGEDAAQEALVAGWRHAGAPPRGRGWAIAVLKNALRQGARSESRRRGREERAARRDSGRTADAPGSTYDVVSRLDVQRMVVNAVEALDEPYRTTVALRFLEGLAPREVARRTGVPVKTVHTRVERGLARLRSRLDAAGGGRRAWLAALLPVAFPRRGAGALASAGLGAVVMGSAVKWTAAALAAGGIAWLGLRALGPVPRGGDAAVGAADATTAVVLRGSSGPALDAPAEPRRPAPPGATVEARAPQAAEPAAPETFVGRVVDLDGAPAAGVRVRFEPTTAVLEPLSPEQRGAESGPDGRFELVRNPARGRLLAEGRGLATVVAAGLQGTAPVEEPVIVVGPAREYGGVVVDPEGRALEGAELAVRLPGDVARRLRAGALTSLVPVARGETDREGAFALAPLGFVPGTALLLERRGFETLSYELPDVSDTALVLTLRERVPGKDELAGVVVEADGTPVAGAWVGTGDATTESDADGRFVLASGDAGVVRAVVAGRRPAEASLAGLTPVERHALVLELGGPALSIAGRVVGVDGRPLAGAQVWTSDGEPFGDRVARIGELEMMVSYDLEEAIGGRRDGRQQHSAEDGNFELTGLVERDYLVHAMHPRTLAVVRVGHVAAGTAGLRVALAGDEPTARVAGRVTRFDGTPIEGALVRASRWIPLLDGRTEHRSADMGFHAVTDADGRYAFEELAVDGTSLLLNGADVATPRTLDLARVADLERADFRVPARCHVRIVLERDPAEATAFALLDAEGELLDLSFLRGSVTLGSRAAGLEAGRSGLVQTDESAVTLVLYREGSEVRRVPVELAAGEVNELRL